MSLRSRDPSAQDNLRWAQWAQSTGNLGLFFSFFLFPFLPFSLLSFPCLFCLFLFSFFLIYLHPMLVWALQEAEAKTGLREYRFYRGAVPVWEKMGKELKTARRSNVSLTRSAGGKVGCAWLSCSLKNIHQGSRSILSLGWLSKGSDIAWAWASHSIPALLSHRWGAAQGKQGLAVNWVMHCRARHWEPWSILSLQIVVCQAHSHGHHDPVLACLKPSHRWFYPSMDSSSSFSLPLRIYRAYFHFCLLYKAFPGCPV